ncbi:unnamed protein product [Rotaria sp. Silwood1]|nr:unnamed protein product [Rotaria sp. Silwood1]CAF3841748.1 unnamed protein product [Rotaria sp. Silwood1]CAF4666823.1 unnamed protein product [Rotaria sp. Silwood1]
MFTDLRYLNFGPSSIWCQQLSFDTQLSRMTSSTVLKLHVCLSDFVDCIYLLDGCFNQLRTLHVNITYIMSSNSTINNKRNIIDHTARLNKFKFTICSTSQLDNELDFPSNENIQKTFGAEMGKSGFIVPKPSQVK